MLIVTSLPMRFPAKSWSELHKSERSSPEPEPELEPNQLSSVSTNNTAMFSQYRTMNVWAEQFVHLLRANLNTINM
jgi:hypothetical protein